MSGNGEETGLDVQQTLRAILHTQARMEVQLKLVIEGLKECLIALGVRDRLERIADQLDEVTPVDAHIARSMRIGR
jgi:uridine phosphorylase